MVSIGLEGRQYVAVLAQENDDGPLDSIIPQNFFITGTTPRKAYQVFGLLNFTLLYRIICITWYITSMASEDIGL